MSEREKHAEIVDAFFGLIDLTVRQSMERLKASKPKCDDGDRLLGVTKSAEFLDVSENYFRDNIWKKHDTDSGLRAVTLAGKPKFRKRDLIRYIRRLETHDG